MELSSEFVQGKWCEINSRGAFGMNVFGILGTSAGAQNFAEGLGHTVRYVTYTGSHIGSLIWFEFKSNFWQYVHVKNHNAVFSIKKHTKKLSWGKCLWGCKGKKRKKERRITISEHKQYFNESYVE